MTRARHRSRPIDLGAPFTRGQARAAGITDTMLAGREYSRVFRGVYLASSVRVTLVVRTRAALLITPPSSVISHHTAATLWGGVPPESSDVHVSVPPGSRPKIVGIRPHRHKEVPPATRRHGLPITSPERTFLEMSRFCDLVDLVVLGDSLVRAGATTPERLVAAANAWKGIRQTLVRRAAGLVRDRVDSPKESRLRMLIVLAGLPEPQVNWEIQDDRGNPIYRLDLSYREYKLAFEFDGRQHIERQLNWEKDLERRADLAADDWRFEVVTTTQMYVGPEQILKRLTGAMRSRGMPVPAQLRTEWRRFFPGKDVS